MKEVINIVNFGIVGLGHIAQKHIKALESNPNARLAAVCDNNLECLAPFIGRHSISLYENFDDFLKDPELEAVIICTPSGLHAAMGEKAALAGKHILMEKPFVLDLNEGKNLTELCKSKQVMLGVVHPNRTKAVVQALSKAVREGWFGTITHVSAVLRWNRTPEYYGSAAWRGTKMLDGGILYNQAIHNIDLLYWLLGPVDEVFAYSATRLHNIECEDVCVCSFKLKNGALGIIEAAVTLYPENLEESISVFGSQGTAVLGGKSLSKIQEWKFSCLSEEEAKSQKEILNQGLNETGHKEIIENFIQAVSQNKEPIVSGEEALRVLYLIEAIYRSVSLKQPIKLASDQEG